MRTSTRKGKIGKRRIFLNDDEVAKESGCDKLFRIPVWGSKLIAGHWYADVFYRVDGLRNDRDLLPSDRWRHPVYLHFCGYGSAVSAGERVLVLLFDEMINDSGTAYKTRRWGDKFSLSGVDAETPLFQPSDYELLKVVKRASEKRHNWSK